MGKRAPEVKSGFKDHKGLKALEYQAPRGRMHFPGFKEPTANLDMMELRGTRVNLESATA